MTESRGSLPAAEGPGDGRGDRHRARRGERLAARGQAAPRLSEARAPLLGGARGAGAHRGFLHGEPTARPKAVHEEEARGFVHTRGGRWQRELLRPRWPPRPRGGHGRLRSP